jgi:hypothetical protein
MGGSAKLPIQLGNTKHSREHEATCTQGDAWKKMPSVNCRERKEAKEAEGL